MKFAFSLVLVLFISLSVADAVTVEETTLLARQPNIFVSNPRHAFNSSSGSTLVIWDRNDGTQERHSLWGRLIDEEGSPSGPLRRIVKGRNAQFPDLTYNPDTNQFLLVYANETNGEGRFEIFAQRLNAIGKKVGKPKRISPISDRGEAINNFAPRTVYDGASQSYLILWRRYAVAQNVAIQDGLYGATFSPDLTERTAPVLMASLEGDFTNLRGPNITDVAFHPTNGKILIAGWTQSTEAGFSVQYFLSRFSPSLTKPVIKLTKLKKNLSSGAAPHAEVVLLPGNRVEALFVEGTGVRRRNVNTKGAPAGPDTLFFTGTIQTHPLEYPVAALASDTGRAETAVVAIDDSSQLTGSLWFQTAAANGTAVGSPFLLKDHIDISQRPLVFALPDHPQNGFSYAVIYVDGVPGTPSNSSGLLLLKVTTP